MTKPLALILKEHGTNCEEESQFAFERAGAKADIVHMEDLIRDKKKLSNYQILMFPGGFSYGDDTGSGMAWANRIKNHLWDEVQKFVEEDHLVLGVCNGFQVMVNLGLLPGLDGVREPQVALTHNDSARYSDRWVDLNFQGDSPWVKDIRKMSMPIAHGEGRFYTDSKTLDRIWNKGLIAARYIEGGMCDYQSLPANPNGSIDDIAGIIDETGRLIGMMPHPERAIDLTHFPNWTLIKEQYKRLGAEPPCEGAGLEIFRNAVEYFGGKNG